MGRPTSAGDDALHGSRRLDPARGRDRRRGVAKRARRARRDSSGRNSDGYSSREVNATGDRFVAMFEAPTSAVRAALAIIKPHVSDRCAGGHPHGGVRAHGGDLAGLAVHIAARVGAEAAAGEVLVSRTVSDVVTGSGLTLDPSRRVRTQGRTQTLGAVRGSSPEATVRRPYTRWLMSTSPIRVRFSPRRRASCTSKAPHRAVQLALRAAHRRHVPVAHRGHRRDAVKTRKPSTRSSTYCSGWGSNGTKARSCRATASRRISPRPTSGRGRHCPRTSASAPKKR